MAQESDSREADDEADIASDDSAAEDHVGEEGEEEEEEEDDILMPMEPPPKPRIRCVIENFTFTEALERRSPKFCLRYKSVCCFGLFQSGTQYGNESCS